MSQYPFPVIGALVVAWSGGSGPVPRVVPTPPPIGYEELYDQIAALSPNANRIATVDHLTLHRDAGTLELNSGQVVLLSPVNGQEVAAVFVGDGTLRVDVPNAEERAEVKRMLERDSLVQHFTSLFVIVTDSTIGELQRSLTFGSGAVPREAANVVKEALDRLTDKDSKEIDTHLAEALLNGVVGQFYAHLYERSRDFLIFHVDPFAREEIAVYKRSQKVFLNKTV